MARQVVALERALLLYQEFIERAGDDPRYAEAVKRSQERIHDANDTLVFLRDDVSGDRGRPPAMKQFHGSFRAE